MGALDESLAPLGALVGAGFDEPRIELAALESLPKRLLIKLVAWLSLMSFWFVLDPLEYPELYPELYPALYPPELVIGPLAKDKGDELCTFEVVYVVTWENTLRSKREAKISFCIITIIVKLSRYHI